MLSLQESVTIFSQDHPGRGGDNLPRHRGVSQYARARRQGQVRRLLKRLEGRPTCLRDLSDDVRIARVQDRHAAGVCSVLIDRILGSEGRSRDFDSEFYPLSSHTDDRWMSVAAAALSGIILPPVDLIQIGDRYYVRDGHHRISVARAFGQQAVDAQVTVWQI